MPYNGEVQFQLRWFIDPVFTYVWWAGMLLVNGPPL